MSWTKFFSWQFKLAVGITLTVISLTNISLQIRAQEARSQVSTVQFQRPPLSPRGAPGDRTGGGTRDGINCPALDTEERLTALIPKLTTSDRVTHVWGLTVEEATTLWFYVPYPSTAISGGELELWDETKPNPRNYQQIYRGTFTLTDTPGVIRLPLPLTVKLESDRDYHWYLSVAINCPAKEVPIYVSGWIQRVEEIPMPSGQLTGREQVIFSAQNGIWQQALTILAELRRNNPDNPTYTADWEKLLADVDLEHLAQSSLVDCCNLESSTIQVP